MKRDTCIILQLLPIAVEVFTVEKDARISLGYWTNTSHHDRVLTVNGQAI